MRGDVFFNFKNMMMFSTMDKIKLFSKYLDAQNRKFIVIERFANVDYTNKTETPSFVKLLDVNGEFPNIIPYADFLNYIKDGRLKQVNQF